MKIKCSECQTIFEPTSGQRGAHNRGYEIQCSDPCRRVRKHRREQNDLEPSQTPLHKRRLKARMEAALKCIHYRACNSAAGIEAKEMNCLSCKDKVLENQAWMRHSPVPISRGENIEEYSYQIRAGRLSASADR
jgi:hypothetical protein